MPALNLSASAVNPFFYLGRFTTSCTIVSTTATTAIFSCGVINGSVRTMMELRKHGPEFEDATMENARSQQTAARVT